MAYVLFRILRLQFIVPLHHLAAVYLVFTILPSLQVRVYLSCSHLHFANWY
jgi:hypothetical protein